MLVLLKLLAILPASILIIGLAIGGIGRLLDGQPGKLASWFGMLASVYCVVLLGWMSYLVLG